MSSLHISTRRPRNSDDSLIPLINIVFLLLIFFMIAGQVSNIENHDLQPPASRSQKPLIKPAVVIVIDKNQQLYLNGEPIELAALQASPLIEGFVAREQGGQFAVKADKNVSALQLDQVLKVLRAKGIASITLFSQLQEGL